LAAEVNPRSATQITRPSVQSRRSSFTCRISGESELLPGQHHTRTGIPSRVTAIPTTTCGRSSRESLDLPCVRNPAFPTAPSGGRPPLSGPRSGPLPRSVSGSTIRPRSSRQSGWSACSVSK
jgi:hypothetical protein